MGKLTKKYINEHMHFVHSYESFGRALVEQVLHAANKQTNDEGVDKAIVDAKFTVTPYEANNCVQICGTYEGATVCYHVG